MTPPNPPTWIALTDAKPSAGDYPIWLAIAGRDDVRPYLCEAEGPFPGGMPTHWCHVEAPAAPIKVFTQRDKDEELCLAAWHDQSDTQRHDREASRDWSLAWHESLWWERRAIRDILSSWSPAETESDLLMAICRRVDAHVGGTRVGGIE